MTRPHRRRRTRRRTDSAPLSIYDPIHFGIDEYGLPVEVTLMYRNLLDGGEPGSGQVQPAQHDHRPRRPLLRRPTVAVRRQDRRTRTVAPESPTCSSATTSPTPSPASASCRPRWTCRYRLLDAVKRRKIARADGLDVIVCVIDELAYFSVTIGTKEEQEEFTQPRPRPGRPGTRRRHHRHRRHPTALGRHHPHQSAGPVRVPGRLPLHHRLQLGHHPVRRLGQGRLLRQEHPPRRHRRRLDPRRRRHPTPVQGRLPDRRADRSGHQHRTAHAWHRPGRINPNPIQPYQHHRIAPAIRTTGGVCPCSP